MQSRLIVKNFGPLKDIDVELKNVNVFIGPQASGKSALAKLFTIFKAPRKFLKDFDKDSTVDKSEIYNKPFRDTLETYNIGSFIYEDTLIKFNSVLHSLSYENGKITYEPILLNKIENLEFLQNNFEENKIQILNLLKEVGWNFILFHFAVLKILDIKVLDGYMYNLHEGLIDINETQFLEIIKSFKEIEIHLSTNTSLYIPAERNFINILKNSAFNLLNNNVPIPKHIILFGAELEKATSKKIDLNFLQKNLFYKNVNGEDRLFIDDLKSFHLSEAASGIQSVLPILISILHRDSETEHRSFVIEEPELNLFPTAQYELIKQLEASRYDSKWEDFGTIHTYTTHSPYILSALNNLLYTNKVRIALNGDKEKIEKLEKILKVGINPSIFTAYQISDGKAQSIFNEETGLIDENFIDEASDKIGDDFDALMELMSQYKHAVK
jgi:AAA ATPase domain